MDTGKRGTLGEFLRRAREARKVEKEVMFWKTKIPFPILTALENDDWDAFPNRKEIPAYLKRYCRYLLLDEAEVFQLYERQPARTPVPTAAATRAEEAVPEILPEIIKTDPLPPPRFSPAPEGSKKPGHAPEAPGLFRRQRIPLTGLAVLVFFLGALVAATCHFHPLLQEGTPPALTNNSSSAEIVKVEVPPPVGKQEKIVADHDRRVYYPPGMKDYQQVKEFHRVEFASEEAAVRAGYRKAKN